MPNKLIIAAVTVGVTCFTAAPPAVAQEKKTAGKDESQPAALQLLTVYLAEYAASRLLEEALSPAGEPSSGATSIAGVKLDKGHRTIEASMETVELDPGVGIRVTKSRTISHEVALNFRAVAGGEAEAGTSLWIAEAKAKVKAELQAELGRTFEQTETFSQEITLDGNYADKYRITWYDKIRSGRVELVKDGRLLSIPFTFRELSEVRVKAVKAATEPIAVQSPANGPG